MFTKCKSISIDLDIRVSLVILFFTQHLNGIILEDFEKNFKVGDVIECTLIDETHFCGKISKIFTAGENSASPELSDFSVKGIDSRYSFENIKFSDVANCKMIKKGGRD